MTELNNIKNSLIDRILVTSNEKLLLAINSILNSNNSNESLKLSEEQILMLEMSERDIKNNDLITENELFNLDSSWMK